MEQLVAFGGGYPIGGGVMGPILGVLIFLAIIFMSIVLIVRRKR